MEHTRWDTYLVAEHELIERAMAVLEDELGKATAHQEDATRLARAVDFLLEFGDKLHNQKEEQLLFPLMESRGIPRHGGPIAVMLAEHQTERALLTRIQMELGQGDAATRAALIQAGKDYLRVRAEHIWKENDVLYLMGRRVISEEDGAALLVGFERLNAESYGEDAWGHFQAMVDELEGGARLRLIERLSYAQIDALMEALPVEVTFVDDKNTLAYFNRLDKEKIFARTRSVVGRKVQKCHPERSVDRVMEIVKGFREGTLENADFWIDFMGRKVLIRYFPVRDREGKYLGVLEVTQRIDGIQKLVGQKVLLSQGVETPPLD
ncbi:PAS domain-containing protein [Myxococcota bacterium]|nr:PAS domain-containing protein [Myxococcota bacterium]MBU1429009.1 PAS domain-containing protein [Myxococcota bacterium]MBU1898435.1 PAS domain-containing protein [Myxococcota bacterium]